MGRGCGRLSRAATIERGGLQFQLAPMESGWKDAGDSFRAVRGSSRGGNAEASDLFALDRWRRRSDCTDKIEEWRAKLPMVAGGIAHRCGQYFWTDGWRRDSRSQKRCAALHAHPVQIQ